MVIVYRFYFLASKYSLTACCQGLSLGNLLLFRIEYFGRLTLLGNSLLETGINSDDNLIILNVSLAKSYQLATPSFTK